MTFMLPRQAKWVGKQGVSSLDVYEDLLFLLVHVRLSVYLWTQSV